MQHSPLASDLADVYQRTRSFWDGLTGKRLFLTGGTGFFGCWLLESFVHVQQSLGLDMSITVLTRNAESFQRRAPRLASASCVDLHEGDIGCFEFPDGPFSHVIHAACETSVSLNREQPLLMFDTAAEGTRRCLEFARRCGARRFLFTSSGAVYGPQPLDLQRVGESFSGAPDPLHELAAYGQGKRVAEFLCAEFARRYGLEAVVARCYAFVGPYLPLNGAFAAGNFVRDALAGGPIRVGGDGTPLRSYLYAADLTAWLWTLLERGASGRAYNVGGSQAVSIAELAHLVAERAGGLPVEVAGVPRPGEPPLRYLPDVSRAAAELDLHAWTPLPEALDRTLRWYRQGHDPT